MINRQIILDFATEAHKGQKRKSGGDYIEHPIEVARITTEEWNSISHKFFTAKQIKSWENILYAIALFHDILEDTNKTVEDIGCASLAAGLDGSETHQILEAVILLTRDKQKTGVLEYLQGIKANWLARFVKLADLRHNMSDLPPGNLLDKYQLCQWYLDHYCSESGYND